MAEKEEAIIEKLALKKKLGELITKYETLISQAKQFCPDDEGLIKEMLDDIKSIDRICKERNKY